MLKTILLILSLSLPLFVGCDSPTKIEDNSESVNITGTIENVKDVALTDSMNVYVFWDVKSGAPDYTYIWGKGEIDKSKMTFKISLTTKPPAEALNNNSFGVGLIAIIDDNELQNGILPKDYPSEKLIGVAGWYAIIYKSNENSDSLLQWIKGFKKGYNVGVGVKGDGIFDGFAPTDNNAVKIIIDDLKNIKVVNWS